jgi:hypothetical protein
MKAIAAIYAGLVIAVVTTAVSALHARISDSSAPTPSPAPWMIGITDSEAANSCIIALQNSDLVEWSCIMSYTNGVFVFHRPIRTKVSVGP